MTQSEVVEKIDLDLLLAMVQSTTEDTPHTEIVEMIDNIRKLIPTALFQAQEAGKRAERKRILDVLEYESIYFLPGSMVRVEGIDKEGNRYVAEWVTRDGLKARLSPQKDKQNE